MLKNLFNLEFATDKSHSFTERKSAIIALSSLLIIILGLLTAWFIVFAIPSIKYSRSLNLVNFDSQKAVAVINTLPDDYKDSKLLKAYINAVDLKNSKDYEASIKEFLTLDGYRDTKEHLSEARYLYAQELISKGEYDTAYEMFVSSRYKDYLMQSYETLYLAGENSFDLYSGAQYFIQIFHYKDAKDKYFSNMYTHAQNLILQGDKITAAETLNEMNKQGSFKDSFTAERKLWYENAIDKAEIGNFKAAKEFIVLAVDYPSEAEVSKLTDEYTNEYHYIKGNEEMSAENYAAALSHFSQISGYKDADLLNIQCEQLAFPWIFTGFLSTDGTEETKTESFLSSDTIYVTGTLTGGKPEKTVNLIFTCTDPRKRTSVCVINDWQDNTNGGCFFTFSHPENAAEGKNTITVQIEETAEIIATFEFQVTVAD